MNILSVNIAHSSIVTINGKPTATAINKRPVESPVFLNTRYLSGDEQADLKNHGGVSKALYAFGCNHFAYWQQYLNKPLSYGDFGENLSIDKLDEREIYIGDEYAVNDAIIVATLFRQPCFKLGAKHDEPKMPADFIAYGYSGAYFGVIKTGFISAGDTLILQRRKQESVSVYELFDACFKPLTAKRKNILVLAANLSDLPEEWRIKAKNRLNSKL